MTPRIEKKLRQARWREQMHVTHRHAAGIDVHANVHRVAVPPGDAPPAPADHPPQVPAYVRCGVRRAKSRFLLQPLRRGQHQSNQLIYGS
jgi:hypothetical protein